MSSVSEDELKAHQKNIGGKRVTLDGLKANIKSVEFMVHPGSQLTLCIITLLNGYTVTGESACADPTMFNEEIGRKISQENAEKKIWPLMGYALKQEIFLAGEGTTFKDRVIAEARELEVKLTNLKGFIKGSVQFKNLNITDQEMLIDQDHAMSSYLWILKKRIERF